MDKEQNFCFIFLKEKGMIIGSVLDSKYKIKYFDEKVKKFEITISKKLYFQWNETIQNDEKTLLNYLDLFKNLKMDIIDHLDFEENKKYTLDELTEIIMKENNVKNRVLTFYMVEKHPTFKRKEDFYFVLSKDQLKIKLYTESLKKWYLSKDYLLKKEEEDYLKIQLLDILDNGYESKYWNEISLIFEFKKSPTSYEVKLMEFFNRLNIYMTWPEFYVKRVKLFREDFQINLIEKEIKNREFYSENTFTIDSESTRDFDDAFTIIDYTQDSITIIVHIIDLSFYINIYDDLFNLAKNRITSAYFLNGIDHMFPRELSENYFSLKSGQNRPTIGYKFLLSKDKIDFKGISLCEIKVKENLTYKQVDKMTDDSFWKVLFEITHAIHTKRINQEGVQTEFTTELKIDVSDINNIKIAKSNRKELKSNCIISELAVLVNQFSAKCFYDKCPILYKQEKWTIKPQDKEDKLYVYCTSPIRRFIDLITQIQLTIYLKENKPVFNEEKLEEYSTLIQERTNFINKTQKQIQDHYIHLYFQQNQSKEFECVLLRRNDKENTVLIKEFDYEIPVYGIDQKKKLNSSFKFKVLNVNIEKHQIFVQE